MRSFGSAIAFMALTFAAPILPAQAATPLRAAGASADVAAVPQDGAKADSLRQSLRAVKLPAGFRIELFAIVPDARHIAVGPRGQVVFVGTRRKSFYAVVPGEGRASVRPLASDLELTMPNGPCFGPDGALFIAEQNRILMLADAENTFSRREVSLVPVVAAGDLVPRSEQSFNHSTRNCRVGPDGKLYVSLGQPFNVAPQPKLDSYRKLGIGGIIRMGRDGSGREVFATGIRNSVGMDFNPADGTLWFTDNQVDGMGDDIPPGELNRATRAGQDFGFPWFGGGHTRTREYQQGTPPRDAVFPQAEMDAHAADLGMVFYTGQQFPQRYRGAIFSAQHGSWNRTDPIGARVMVTFLKPDGTADKTEVFAQGWLTPDGRYLGRPVDVAVLGDGSLLVSDDKEGALYRISYEGR